MTKPITVLAHQTARGDVILDVAVALLAISLLHFALRVLPTRGLRDRTDRLARLCWNIGSLLGLEQAYEFTRGTISHQTDIALQNATRILDFEWRYGFFVESRVERFFLHFGAVMNAVDLFYALAHVCMTIGTLVYLYAFKREYFPFARNLLMLTTVLALVAFYVYPTAPPRMLPNYGFVDPLQLYGLAAQGGSQADSYTYNPYAAMPSLHVGYALAVAWSLIRAARAVPTRIIIGMYPVTMAAVVIISANHWVMDVIGACVTVGIGAAILAVFNCLVVVARSQRPFACRRQDFAGADIK